MILDFVVEMGMEGGWEAGVRGYMSHIQALVNGIVMNLVTTLIHSPGS
jgi:hypothetical protein